MTTPVPPPQDLSDPLSVIIWERTDQLNICGDLERIADQLGGTVDRGLCSSVLNKLRHGMPLYHRDEEVLFNILVARHEDDVAIARCIRLSLSEHRNHEAFVCELAEPLVDLGVGKTLFNIHAVGYMLRHCFEGIQRHMSWEDAALLDGRLNSLTGADTKLLSAGLAGNRRALDVHLRIAD